jgi:membrane associated rhomboid family serine protease
MNDAVPVIAAIVVISAAAQMCTDPRVSRLFAEKNKLMIAFYALYGAMSVAALAAFVPRGQVAAFGAFAAVLGWIGLGGLAYFRFTTPMPAPTRVMYVGAPDIMGLVVITAGMAQAMLLT